MPSESTFTGGINPLCPDSTPWNSRDEQSSEDEVNEFLHSLIRLIKPKFVVETGCYLGDGTIEIAIALKQNGFGKLITCDTVPERVNEVNRRLKEEELDDVAQAVLETGESLITKCGHLIDFAFIDSSPYGKVRESEINALIPFMKPLDICALHDGAPQHPTIREAAKHIKLHKFYLNCPRGLYLFQKPL